MKILWLKTELLHPVDKGGKIRTYQMLRHLNREHELTYLTLATPGESDQAAKLAYEYCAQLIRVPWEETRKFTARFYSELVVNLSSALPYAIEKYRSRQMRQEIERQLKGGGYDLVVSDFLVPSINIPRTLNRPAVLFQHNVESNIWKRHYEQQRSGIKQKFFYGQWQKMVAYETETCRRFDAVVAVSEVDRDFMREQFGVNEVHDVPTGVDFEYFCPTGMKPDRKELVFTGSMDWMPNEDAIVYFADEILPKVQAAIPDARLTVVGREPGGRLKALAKQNSSIQLTGRVPDVRPYVERAGCYIVPLRIGGGTRLKIYEAMAMGKPVVSTTVGAEGLPLRDGTEIFIADDPTAFAQSVVQLMTNPQLAETVGTAARETVRQNFGWDRAAEAFSKICERTLSMRSQGRAA